MASSTGRGRSGLGDAEDTVSTLSRDSAPSRASGGGLRTRIQSRDVTFRWDTISSRHCDGKAMPRCGGAASVMEDGILFVGGMRPSSVTQTWASMSDSVVLRPRAPKSPSRAPDSTEQHWEWAKWEPAQDPRAEKWSTMKRAYAALCATATRDGTRHLVMIGNDPSNPRERFLEAHVWDTTGGGDATGGGNAKKGEAKKEEAKKRDSKASTSGCWRKLEYSGSAGTVIPLARRGHAVAGMRRHVFVFGGQVNRLSLRESRRDLLGDLHAVNVRTGRWGKYVGTYSDQKAERKQQEELHVETTGKPPCCRTMATMVRKSVNLILHGGHTYDVAGQMQRLNDVHVFDTQFMAWSKIKTSGVSPTPRSCHSSVIVNEMMLVFGGNNGKGEEIGELQVLDLLNWKWRKPEPSGHTPRPRSAGHMVAVTGPGYPQGASTARSVFGDHPELGAGGIVTVFLFGGFEKPSLLRSDLHTLTISRVTRSRAPLQSIPTRSSILSPSTPASIVSPGHTPDRTRSEARTAAQGARGGGSPAKDHSLELSPTKHERDGHEGHAGTDSEHGIRQGSKKRGRSGALPLRRTAPRFMPVLQQRSKDTKGTKDAKDAKDSPSSEVGDDPFPGSVDAVGTLGSNHGELGGPMETAHGVVSETPVSSIGIPISGATPRRDRYARPPTPPTVIRSSESAHGDSGSSGKPTYAVAARHMTGTPKRRLVLDDHSEDSPTRATGVEWDRVKLVLDKLAANVSEIKEYQAGSGRGGGGSGGGGGGGNNFDVEQVREVIASAADAVMRDTMKGLASEIHQAVAEVKGSATDISRHDAEKQAAVNKSSALELRLRAIEEDNKKLLLEKARLEAMCEELRRGKESELSRRVALERGKASLEMDVNNITAQRDKAERRVRELTVRVDALERDHKCVAALREALTSYDANNPQNSGKP